MGRSVKKGPFVQPKLLERVEEMNKKGEKIVLVHTGGSPAIYTPFHRAEMEKELMEGYHLL